MEKKPYSKQEIGEALRKANVPEKLINAIENPDVQKLPPEMLDAVSGGGVYGPGATEAPGDWPNPLYHNMTMIEAQYIVDTVEKTWGKDVCIAFCNETFWKSYDWKTWIEAGGGAYAVDMMWSICYKLCKDK